MSSRWFSLAVMSSVVLATAGCAAVVEDSDPGTTLAPLPTPASVVEDTEVPTSTDDTADTAATSTTDAATTTGDVATAVPVTSTTVAPVATSIVPTSSTTSTTEVATTTTTEQEDVETAGGVRATIAGRNLGFSDACRDGANVKLDGVTWAFAGNSFRFAGDGDVRSEAELVGDGWTMPMLVAGVSNGVYTYQGSPVEGSVPSAQVVVDFNALDGC